MSDLQPFPADHAKIKALPWCLASGMLNSVFALWTFGGSVFVLFLNELGLPKGQIGLMLSLFPFCGLVALAFAPVAARLGRKRVFLACYGSRKLVISLLLLLPWVVSGYGRTAAFLFLCAVIVGFALLRALAETAYYPWWQEFIPNRVRGKFVAWATVLGMIASAIALGVASHVIAHGEGLQRYLVLIGAGALFGIVGVALMLRVPGGAPIPATPEDAHGANMAAALRDRNLLLYLGGMAGQTIGLAMLVSFLPLYIREQMGLPSEAVVRLDIVAMVGGALASLGWGWLSDKVGSRPVLMPSAALLLLLPLGWLLLPRQLPQLFVWCGAFYFIFGVANNGALISSGRLFFNSVAPPEKSTAYMAVYYAWMGVTGGVAPLLAGAILSFSSGWKTRLFGMTVDGYAILFATALAFLGAGWYLYGRVRPDGRHTTRTVLRRFFTLGREFV
jgi:MFS family permease